MGRNRMTHDKLPRNVYPDQKSQHYYYRAYLGKGKRAKAIKLCKLSEPYSVVWREYETLTQTAEHSFKKISELYQESADFRKLKERTKKEYLYYHTRICSMQINNGSNFGNLAMRDIATPLMQNYIDAYIDNQGQPSAGAKMANNTLGYVSTVFSWSRRYGHATNNPCLGVRRVSIKPRQHYVDDQQYKTMYNAKGLEYLQPFMEIAYLCRARPDETRKIKLIDDGINSYICKKGIFLRRDKGSKNQMILMSPRLEAAIKHAKSMYSVSSIYLIHDRSGQYINTSAFGSAWDRKREKAELIPGFVPFRAHDLKRKGVTDFKGDKLKASGHRDPKMLKTYDVSQETVSATRMEKQW